MDRVLSALLAVLLVLWSVPVVGAPPVEATVCEISQKPSQFNGKLVHVNGTVRFGFENFSLFEGDGGCGATWVDLADDPHVNPKPEFELIRDAAFSEFERQVKAHSMAEVSILGRLDGVDQVTTTTHVRNRREHKDGTVSAVVAQESTGFGHLGQYKARVVLKQVLAVRPTPSHTSPSQTRQVLKSGDFTQNPFHPGQQLKRRCYAN